ncbi:MAG: glycosyltransferase 87 family protein, partial [Chloroflexota bacterium]|nr:glycosyltransferase 87 family protein [Chloroflexota bacterium]
AVSGVNDSSPGFFITAGLLALRERPLLGGALLAVAAALKPYAFAWFPAAIGYRGLPALLGAALGTAVLWSPLLVWGPFSFLRSLQMAENLPHHFSNAANVPVLRLLSVPVALASLFVRRWEWAVVSGAVIFLTVLFFARWASAAYVLAALPILGIVLETELLGGRRERPRWSGDTPDTPVSWHTPVTRREACSLRESAIGVPTGRRRLPVERQSTGYKAVSHAENASGS